MEQLIQELKFFEISKMKLLCYNQATLHITSNPIFHKKTKHLKIDCHFIQEEVLSDCTITNYINSNDQLADIFTKFLQGSFIVFICNSAYDLYTPT